MKSNKDLLIKKIGKCILNHYKKSDEEIVNTLDPIIALYESIDLLEFEMLKKGVKRYEFEELLFRILNLLNKSSMKIYEILGLMEIAKDTFKTMKLDPAIKKIKKGSDNFGFSDCGTFGRN
jgi:hypothetical protein